MTSAIAPPTTTAASSATNASTALSATFDTFLKLLTTQLQNQDPLSPMDSAKFTEQLVQYSQVEQQISTNKKLDALASQLTSSGSIGSLSYLGKTGLFDSNAAALTDAGATWQYAMGASAANTTISVLNAKGDVVFTANGALSAGQHSFTWDGKKADGSQAANGIYTLKVVAKTSDSKDVETAIAVSERITGVDFSGAAPAVTTATGSHLLSKIMRIQETAS